jgi:hypothetical protein
MITDPFNYVEDSNFKEHLKKNANHFPETNNDIVDDIFGA